MSSPSASYVGLIFDWLRPNDITKSKELGAELDAFVAKWIKENFPPDTVDKIEGWVKAEQSKEDLWGEMLKLKDQLAKGPDSKQ